MRLKKKIIRKSPKTTNKFNIGDLVYHKADSSPFKVLNIRVKFEEGILVNVDYLIEGDWSGGTHNMIQAGWVEGSEIERYDINKVKTYTNG